MDFPLPKKIRLTSYAGAMLDGTVLERYDGPCKIVTLGGAVSYTLQSGDYVGTNVVMTFRYLSDNPTLYVVAER